MELVPCERAASGPTILVRYWCHVNGQLVDQLSWYESGAGMELVLVVHLCWFGTEVL